MEILIDNDGVGDIADPIMNQINASIINIINKKTSKDIIDVRVHRARILATGAKRPETRSVPPKLSLA